MENSEMDSTDILQKYFAQATNTNAIAITKEATAPKHPDVSVIVPVFNMELYLKDCLDSLLAQSHSNIEIICINDASTDDSLEILKKYAKKDTRMRIYSFEENVGVASCRNYALERACGEYISFVDSDDWVSLNFYGKLYKLAKDGNYDVVKGEFYYAHEDGTYELSNTNTKITNCLNQNKFIGTVFCVDFWTALYRNVFLQNIHAKFPKLSNSEDTVFLFNVLFHNPKFSLINDTSYYYRQRQGSAHNSHVSLKVFSVFASFEVTSALLDKSPMALAEYMEFYCHYIYEGMLLYYKDVLFFGLPKQESLYLQKIIDILKKCQHLDLLLEYIPHPFLKKLIKTNSITQSDILLLKKEIFIGAHGFIFSYCKYWLRYKLARKETKPYYKQKYLICKRLMQLKHELSRNLV